MATIPPIELIDANINMVGTWNPAIFSPAWIVTEFASLLGGQQPDVEYQMVPKFVVSYKIRGLIHLIPQSERVIIRALDPVAKDAMQLVSDFAGAILKKLPHTPVFGIGSNFEFQIGQQAPGILIPAGSLDSVRSLYGDPDQRLREVAASHVVEAPDKVMTLTCRALVASECRLAFNHHYNTINATASARLGVVEKLDRDFEISYSLASKLVNTTGKRS